MACQTKSSSVASANASPSASSAPPASAYPTGSTISPPSAPSVEAVRAPSDVVGTARIKPDGTIELDMFAPSARLTYAPDHPQYLEIRHHIEQRGGMLVPGVDRPVAPFPPPAVPAMTARISGRLVLDVVRETSGWSKTDPRRAQDLFVAPAGTTPRFTFLDRAAPHPSRPGLRIPAPVVVVLPQAAAAVDAEKAKLENYDVEAAIENAVVRVTLDPHFAPGEKPHPGGRTSLGPDLILTFDAKTGDLQKKLYGR